MKEPLLLIPINRLDYSYEILRYKEPKELSVTVWIIATLCLCVVCWIVFGKMEEVVPANGIVRPCSNISHVKNAVSGEITGLYYSPGCKVEKGALLLQIDSRAFSAKETALKTSFEKLRIKTEGLRQTEKSFYSGRVCIDKTNTSALMRFNAYRYQKEVLEKQYVLAEKTWQDALSMPAEAVTPVKLHELEYEKNLRFFNLETYKASFIKQISDEYIQSIVELEGLKSRLEQVRMDIKNASVYAPITGTVQEVSSLNKNDYLFADQNILNIIPADTDAYRVELRIPAKMSGRLKENMRVKFRFPAFPFYEFGGLEGKIISIDPDVSADARGFLYFTVLTDMDAPFLEDKKKHRYPIKSGLETDARIILKEQTVLWYILKRFDSVW
ncbi:HlyD family efflux transporter periplasmic adaptor subunit [Treponema sp. OMZ 840]|uniref:HlyD family secretion protein n=1 Tax=Treponema sp. OMZ 840 TaxID=244313 RepID=UPI003D8A2947